MWLSEGALPPHNPHPQGMMPSLSQQEAAITSLSQAGGARPVEVA